MPQTIQARIEEAAGAARKHYPLTHGCPFPAGALKHPTNVRLLAGGGELPLQTTVLATWPDGSIKWLLLDSQLDVDVRQIMDLQIEYGDDVVAKPVSGPLAIRDVEGGIEVDTGALTVRLNTSGPSLFAQAGDVLVADTRPQMTLTDGAPGTEGAGGKLYIGQVESLEVEEANALRLVVKAAGGYIAEDGTRPLSWVMRMYFFANQPFVKLYHTFIHDQPEPVLFSMRELKLSLPVALQGDPHVMIGCPAYTTAFGDDFGRVPGQIMMWEHDFDQYSIIGAPQGRIDRRTRSHGWIYAADDARAAMLKLRNPGPNYPKIYATDGSRIEIHLYPDVSRWAPPADSARRYTEIDLVHDGEYDGALQIPQGMAKTNEIFAYFGAPTTDIVEAASMAAAWQHPLLLEIDSAAYADSDALGSFPRYYPEYWRMEALLAQGTGASGGFSRLMGMMSYGDIGRVTTVNGKQVTLTTDNVAYDQTRSTIRQYIRRADQPTFWLAEAMAFHLMDVDTTHFSSEHPEQIGGPRMEWSQFHHYADTSRTQLASPGTSHTWLGGLMDYYYLTGYRRALEVAEATAGFCARTPMQHCDITPEIREQWRDQRVPWQDLSTGFSYCTRTAGWALNGMCEMYEHSRDPKLESVMRTMVDVFERWQDADGRWRNVIGSLNRGSTPFMTAGILSGLMRVYELLGEQRALTMCINGCRFLATTMVNREGLMYYKEAPVTRGGGHSSTILAFRPMAFAYAHTGDKDILRCMWRLYRWRMENGGIAGYEIKDALWALPTFASAGLGAAAGLLELWRNEDV